MTNYTGKSTKTGMTKFFKGYILVLLIALIYGCAGAETPVQPDTTESESKDAVPVEFSDDEVLFTDSEVIAEGEISPVIFDRLLDLIHATPDGESIHLSIYLFDYEPMIEALTAAHGRGVSLNIMMDMSDRSDNLATANRFTELGDGVDIVRVFNDAGRIAINHNKFVLFSEVETTTGSEEHVVVQTSQNFKESGAKKLQDALILRDERLFEAYLNYWQEMKNRAGEGMADFEFMTYHSPEEKLEAYFYPKRIEGRYDGEDTVIELLNNISDPASAEIKIGMSAWSDSRVHIVDKLEELIRQGATVDIITKSSIGAQVLERLEAIDSPNANILIFNMSNEGPPRINIHTKLMLIEGEWSGEKMKLLVTGTQNFTNNALKNNNEVTLLLKNHEFFSEYNSYFEALKELPAVCCNLQN